jgi:tripartite-type tricarboxylate transporter receptor subunit TctC
VQYTFDGVATSLGYARAGSIRILGTAGPKRSPVIPDVPAITEKALPGFETVVWFGLFAPARTPPAVVDLINRKTNEVLAMPSIQESFAKLGIEGVGGTPEVLAARVRSEMEKWAKLVRERNLRFEQ